jgi:DNA-binding PadR family transcriptional regulator
MNPPVFAHGHLRLYLLSLLAVQPMHGYDLIQALSDRFGGTYVPSAGTIYPRLAKLEEDGLVTKQAEGRKTVYAITDAGRVELTAREPELDGIESELSDSVRRLADEVRSSVNDAMKSLRADLAAATRDARQDARQNARSTFPQERDDDPRVQVRILLHEAETAVSEFRADLRAELRTSAAVGRLPKETVTLLKDGLRDLRREIVASLR